MKNPYLRLLHVTKFADAIFFIHASPGPTTPIFQKTLEESSSHWDGIFGVSKDLNSELFAVVLHYSDLCVSEENKWEITEIASNIVALQWRASFCIFTSDAASAKR